VNQSLFETYLRSYIHTQTAKGGSAGTHPVFKFSDAPLDDLRVAAIAAHDASANRAPRSWEELVPEFDRLSAPGA